jgi:hypothetical protein
MVIQRVKRRAGSRRAWPAIREKLMRRPSSRFRSLRNDPDRKVRSPIVKSPRTVRQAMSA